MDFRVRTLGGLTLERDGRPLAGGATQPRRLAVLALLARAGARGLTRDRMVGLLWPEAEEERARRALSQALYALRQELGSEEVIVGVQDLRLNPDLVRSDVIEFETALGEGRVSEAVVGYGGPFLDGFHLSGAPDFERWVEDERAELARRYAEGLEQLATEATTRGDGLAAVSWWRKLAAQDPVNSRFALGLMEALSRAGDRAGAIQHARIYQLLVEESLDIQPDHRVVALAERLREESPASSAAPSVAPAPVLVDVPLPRTQGRFASAFPHELSRFVGRPRVVTLTIALSLAGIAAVYFVQHQPSGIVPGNVRRLVIGPELELDPALSPDGRLLAFSAESAGTMRLRVRQVAGEQDIPLAPAVSGSQRWPRWSPDGSEIAFQSEGTLYVAPALGGAARVLAAPEGPADWAAYPAWSPDGREFAYVRNWKLYVRSVRGGPPRLIAESLEAPHSLAWSPDGEWIALVDGNPSFVFGSEPWGTLVNLGNAAPSSVWVVPARGGEPVRVSDERWLNTSPAWLPRGRSLLYVSNRDGGRDVYRLRLGEDGHPRGEPERVTVGAGPHTIALSADGTSLTYTVFDHAANVYWLPIPATGPATPSAARPITTGNQAIEGVGLSPDGEWLAFDSNRNGNHDIFKLPVEGGDPIQLTSGRGDEFMASWSPDGREIAFYSFMNGVRWLEIVSRDGGQTSRVADRPEDQRFPGWSPDGRSLVFSSNATGRMELYVTSRMSGGQWSAPRQLTFEGGAAGRWSPRGDQIAYVRSDGLWAIPSGGGQPRPVLRIDPARDPAPVVIQWSGDSRTLYYKAFDGRNRSSIWSLPATGGMPRLLVQFDDSSHRSSRPEFATDGRRLFFTLAEHRADIWIMQLGR